MSTSLYNLGVDGGGTKTVAWLASGDEILGRGNSGPGNPRAAGFETAQDNIAAAIAAAFADAGLPPQEVSAACFGLAGAGRAIEQERIAAWALGRGIARQVKVIGDAELILAAASPENCGVALIAGTGSLAWGRNAAGETARCGGWGYLLGDEGSGYAIAQAGLKAAMRAADGRGPQTDLLAAFLNELDVDSSDDLIGKVYAPDFTRERLASLAGIVFEYRSTDAVAEQIIDVAAGDLAAMVATVASRLNLPPGYTLGLTGGVLLHQLNYIDLFVMSHWARTAASGPQPGQWIKVEEPVRGAIALARQLALGGRSSC